MSRSVGAACIFNTMSQSRRSGMESASNSGAATSNGGPVKEHLFKVLVIGELGTGKTSFIKRYVHQTFTPHYRATIGVDFALKVVPWDNGRTMVRLQLWDIAGQERFGQMTRVYYKEAVGCFVVYDVTRRATFEAAIKWKEDLDSKVRLPNGSKIPCVLIGSKSDLLSEGGMGCNDRDMTKFCQDHAFNGWYEVSSMTNNSIDLSANFLIEKMLEVCEYMSSDDYMDSGSGGIRIDPALANAEKKKCC